MLMVVGVVVLVAILFIIQNSRKPAGQSTQTTSSTSNTCQVQVTADVLNVRSAPNGTAKVVATLTNGAVKSATSTVQNNFRELAPNQWAAAQFLKTVSGSC
jgi:hypothetical protein